MKPGGVGWLPFLILVAGAARLWLEHEPPRRWGRWWSRERRRKPRRVELPARAPPRDEGPDELTVALEQLARDKELSVQRALAKSRDDRVAAGLARLIERVKRGAADEGEVLHTLWSIEREP